MRISSSNAAIHSGDWGGRPALIQLGVNLRRCVVEAELENGDVGSLRHEELAQLELVDERLRVRQAVERARVVRQHEVGLMADDLREADVALVVALEVIEQIRSVTGVLVTTLLGQRVPLSPVEGEHPMENPPSFQGLGDVWVAHSVSRPCSF